MHAWTLMAVGPWVGLGVAYGLSVRSLLRQRHATTRLVDDASTEIRIEPKPAAASNA